MASTQHVSDVRLRWSHLMNGTVSKTKKGSENFPPREDLVKSLVTEGVCMHSVLIALPDGDTVAEIREWLEEHAPAQYRIFGRYQWADYGVRVTRDVKGLRFHFVDEDTALFFKFRWATGMHGI